MHQPVAPFDAAAHFGREAPLALDIGCGPGRFVVDLARARPHFNVLGLEIRDHLVEATNAAVAEANAEALASGAPPLYAHARVANANLHLPQLIGDKTLHFVSVNFPDPWYKKRHHKRRVLNDAFLPLLLAKMADGGEIHVMTDYAPIAEAMRASLAGAAQLHALHGTASWCAHSTTGLTSEREQIHMARNEPIWRMAYRYDAGERLARKTTTC